MVDLLGPAACGEFDRSREEEDFDDFQVCERGVKVRPDDAESFARGLEYLIGAEEFRRAMGARGRLYVERNYSIERLLSDVLHLYEELLDSAGRRAEGAGPAGNISRVAESARLKGD